MTVTREQVVAAARGWLGTPYVHQHRAKGSAVDCAGLVVGVARELGLVAPDFDVQGYQRQATGTSLVDGCDRVMTRIRREQMQPGDVVGVRFRDGAPQHLGIVYAHRYGTLGMIHASDARGRVVEHRLVFGPAMQFVAAWALPGVA